jgi:hypothetical protein
MRIAGFDIAEALRKEFAGEKLSVPRKMPKTYIVRLIKNELMNMSVRDVANVYGIPERTVRDYRRWQLLDDRMISPGGKEYFYEEIE